MQDRINQLILITNEYNAYVLHNNKLGDEHAKHMRNAGKGKLTVAVVLESCVVSSLLLENIANLENKITQFQTSIEMKEKMYFFLDNLTAVRFSLNQLLIDNYLYLARLSFDNSKSQYFKKISVLLQTNKKLYEKSDQIKNNKLLMFQKNERGIVSEYNAHFNTINKKINELLMNVASAESDEQVELFYQQAEKLDAENNVEKSLFIVWHRAEYLLKNLNDQSSNACNPSSEVKLEALKELFKKIDSVLVTAVTIPEKNYEKTKGIIQICSNICAVYRKMTSYIFVEALSLPTETSDLTKKESLLRTALAYNFQDRQLAKWINKTSPASEKLKIDMDKALEEIHDKRKKIKEKELEQEKKNNELAKYNENFSEILFSFEASQPHKKKHQGTNEVSKLPVEHDVSDRSENDFEEEEAEVEIETNLINQTTYFFIELDNEQRKLALAIEQNDLPGQIRNYAAIADHYRLQFLGCRRNIKNSEAIINNIELAIENLDKAVLLLKNVEKAAIGLQGKLDEEKNWIVTISAETKNFLTYYFNAQYQQEQNKRNTHELVKKAIISKNGSAAWFRNDTKALAKASKEKQMVNERLTKLHTLELKVNEIHKQIQNLSFLQNETSTVDGTVSPQLNRLPSQLLRSHSHNSFFNPVTVQVRKDKRKGYGRQPLPKRVPGLQ